MQGWQQGTHGRATTRHSDAGIIPAGAGSMCRTRSRPPIPRDHPRGCGEHSFMYDHERQLSQDGPYTVSKQPESPNERSVEMQTTPPAKRHATHDAPRYPKNRSQTTITTGDASGHPDYCGHTAKSMGRIGCMSVRRIGTEGEAGTVGLPSPLRGESVDAYGSSTRRCNSSLRTYSRSGRKIGCMSVEEGREA
ncbi:hypothetical protein DSM100688_0564 [Bifidobacterium ramosum]|uniref:Uncharacterized protein n=1 Tax=Bifidobacterium ramosum TaxID=1798158 RepID=A0A6L4X1Q5_9BIFI|nr:hypothetical protein DSM100688_0564 [Bifidobacterium ramosum]